LTEVAKAVCRELRKSPTKAERIFWEEVRNKKFRDKKFYRQYPIFHDLTGKETFFIADFFCFEEKLVIELDGDYHQYRLKDDEERTKILNHLGLKVIRFHNQEITEDIKKVLSIIDKYVTATNSYS
jgi:leucyl-tRNA synthetase